MNAPETTPTTRAIGTQFRARRKQLGLTQRDLSELSGASLSLIHRLENGHATVQFGKSLDVARALGLEVKFAVRSPGNPEQQ